MTSIDNRFPLLADHEPVIVERPYMNLYEETDLISNIKGPYQEKDYGRAETGREEGRQPQETLEPMSASAPSQTPTEQAARDFTPPHISRPHIAPQPVVTPPIRTHREPAVQAPLGQRPTAQGKSMGQLAREEAHEDVKRKRQAPYLQDSPSSRASVNRPSYRPVAPTTPTLSLGQDSEAERLSRLSQPLHQETYILADMPAVYSLEIEDRQQSQDRPRNSYDFLKKSQAYNYPDRQQERQRQVAQELNLTQMEEEN